MTTAVVSGIGEFHPVRKSGKKAEALIVHAISEALNDAGLAPDQIGAVVTESSLTPQMAPFDRIAPMAGLDNVQLTLQTSPVGAGIMASVGMAFDLVASGKVDHALIYFGVDWGTTPNGPTGYHAGMEAKKVVEAPAGFAGPALYYAVAAKRYQHLHGLTDDQVQDMLWAVVEATRFNASHHPLAQRQDALTKDQYLAKPMLAEPLRSVDCSLLSDGAVALVVSKADAFNGKQSPVELASWAYDYEPIPDMDFYTQSPWLPALPATRRSSQKALKAAGLAIEDMDLFGIYDCFSFAVIMQLEALGLCKAGEGAQLCQLGALRFNGQLPVNTHGGLMGHGYLLGAGHITEIIHQLRHQAGARQVQGAQTAFVGAGPGRQFTSLIFKRQEG
ncbi:MAG: thiolase family protein [Porticoccaceae bacterium]|nr:thiolase family protein [Pseudomonadales bacterium]MCP5172164.1 thiolase family protein [Pseudomonadales bacterium]